MEPSPEPDAKGVQCGDVIVTDEGVLFGRRQIKIGHIHSVSAIGGNKLKSTAIWGAFVAIVYAGIAEVIVEGFAGGWTRRIFWLVLSGGTILLAAVVVPIALRKSRLALQLNCLFGRKYT